MTALRYGSLPCSCTYERHEPRFVAVTGGPGAGKTAILEMSLRSFCNHVAVLPEAASLVFGGGFPRHDNVVARQAAQRAIFHVQREVEALIAGEGQVAVGLCDRGTVDGVAYWPGDPDVFWSELGTSRAKQLARYAAVIHLRTPPPDEGYNHQNPLRTETPSEAMAIDERILAAWEGHPNRHIVPAEASFERKVARTLALLRAELPRCCREHGAPAPAAGA